MAVHEERQCLECGAAFITSNGKQIYCSGKCKKRAGKRSNPDLMRRGNTFTTDKGYMNRVSAFSARFEYIGNSKDFLYLICKDCGTAMRKSKVSLKPSHRGVLCCPNCDVAVVKARQRARQHEKAESWNNYLAYLEQCRQAREQKAKERVRTLVCQRCGAAFASTNNNRKYCSKLCARRQGDSNKEHSRRAAVNGHGRDVISLPRLAKRDGNKCWICNSKVDWQDYHIMGKGTFVAGDKYPSIDHVFPLAKGGTHTWDNVKLAHRGCNSRKSAALTIEERGGQMRLLF